MKKIKGSDKQEDEGQGTTQLSTVNKPLDNVALSSSTLSESAKGRKSVDCKGKARHSTRQGEKAKGQNQGTTPNSKNVGKDQGNLKRG
jgi:hypothetical protein